MNESIEIKRFKGEDFLVELDDTKRNRIGSFARRARPLCERIMKGSRTSVGILHDWLAYYQDSTMSDTLKLLFFMYLLCCKTLNRECSCFLPKLIAFNTLSKRKINNLGKFYGQDIVLEIENLGKIEILLSYLTKFFPHTSITNPTTPAQIILYAKIYGTTFGCFCNQADSLWGKELTEIFEKNPFQISIAESLQAFYRTNNNDQLKSYWDGKLLFSRHTFNDPEYTPLKQSILSAKAWWLTDKKLFKDLEDTVPIILEDVIADRKRRMSILVLLFLARNDQNSFFYSKRFPRDMFRLIIGLIAE